MLQLDSWRVPLGSTLIAATADRCIVNLRNDGIDRRGEAWINVELCLSSGATFRLGWNGLRIAFAYEIKRLLRDVDLTDWAIDVLSDYAPWRTFAS